MTNVVKHDKLDQLSYQRGYDESTRLQDSVESQEDRLATVKELSEDLFYSMYRRKPVMAEETPASHQLNRQLIENVQSSSQYEKLRAFTKVNRAESVMATNHFMDKVLENIPAEQLEEANNHVRELDALETQAQRLQDQIGSYQQLTEDVPPEHPIHQRRQDAEDALRMNQQQQGKVDQELSDQMEGMGYTLRRAAHQALAEATQEISDFQEAAAGWGLDAGQLEKVSFQDKLDLAELLRANKRLKEISMLLGRLKRLTLQKRSQRTKPSHREFVGVETGGNLSRLLPSEMTLLGDETTELLFMKKFIEKQLFQYATGGKETKGRGPIVVCVDESGSMEGLPLIWSKAITLALADLANKEGRKFAAFSFGSRTELKAWGQMKTPQDSIAFAQHFLNGGTDFERPLTEAANFIEENREFKEADIVFITDGTASVSPEFLKNFRVSKEFHQFQVHAVAVGRDARPRSLAAFADQVHSLLDLTKETSEHGTSGAIIDGLLS